MAAPSVGGRVGLTGRSLTHTRPSDAGRKGAKDRAAQMGVGALLVVRVWRFCDSGSPHSLCMACLGRGLVAK